VSRKRGKSKNKKSGTNGTLPSQYRIKLTAVVNLAGQVLITLSPDYNNDLYLARAPSQIGSKANMTVYGLVIRTGYDMEGQYRQ